MAAFLTTKMIIYISVYLTVKKTGITNFGVPYGKMEVRYGKKLRIHNAEYPTGRLEYIMSPTEKMRIHVSVHPTEKLVVLMTVYPTEKLAVIMTVYPTEKNAILMTMYPTEKPAINMTEYLTDKNWENGVPAHFLAT